METVEHTELGNAIRIKSTHNNPYLRIDEMGSLHVRLQRLTDRKCPEPMDLELSAGEIIALAGDYFTQADWTMDLSLPSCESFSSPVELGKYLIKQPITERDQCALLKAYNNLAAPDVTREQIAQIYEINEAEYLPCSKTLNGYARQLALLVKVKNYGEMITRNQTHFTPWSIKAYVLGHSIALRYARLSHELMQLATDKDYNSDNPDFKNIKNNLSATALNAPQGIIDLAHRYHALAYGVELFAFHYYSDHFATGHMSMIADLRVELGKRFGTLGNILANNLHDEVNRVGVFTSKPYDPTPNNKLAAIRSRGDGQFDSCLNQANRKACIAGMTASMSDIDKVFKGQAIPAQNEYGGLEHMPDVDFNVRQHEPLLLLSQNKIYRRQHPSKINIISPSEYEAIRANPEQHGYVEVANKADAFALVSKLRLFPYCYSGKIQPVSDEKRKEIKADERQRNPNRHQIRPTHCKPEAEPNALDWRTNKEYLDTLDGLNRYSVLRLKRDKKWSEQVEGRHDRSLGL